MLTYFRVNHNSLNEILTNCGSVTVALSLWLRKIYPEILRKLGQKNQLATKQPKVYLKSVDRTC